MFCIVTMVAISVLIIMYYIIDWLLRSLKIGNIPDKYIFITGCDTGFGHLAAVQFDKLGFHVFAGCLTKEGAQSVTEKCSSRVTTVDLDIRSTQSIEKAYQFVESHLPPNTGLWALINNAGISGLFAPLEMCSREAVLEAINVNLLGPIDMTRQFLPLIRRCQGRIVNTASSGGRVAFLPVPYTVSKYGVVGFSDKLRREVSQQGIKVSVVEPGAFKTTISNTDRIVHDTEKAFDKTAPEIQSVYGGAAAVRSMREMMTTINNTASTDLGLVVDDYIHAVTSRFPRIRYLPGRDAKLFYNPLSFLPDSIADFVLARLL